MVDVSAVLALGGPEGLPVLYRDNHVLVLDKPAGLLSQAAEAGGDCVAQRVERWLVALLDKPGRAFVGLVHRLDRNTSGALVMARTSKAAGRLSAAFAQGEVHKTYICLAVARRGLESEGRAVVSVVKDPVERKAATVPRGHEGAVPAALSWQVLGRCGSLALVMCRPETGRFHQVRVQLAALGAPLLGDGKYGGPRACEGVEASRPLLHAWAVDLPHPVRKAPDGQAQRIRVRADLPPDLRAALAVMKLAEPTITWPPERSVDADV